MKDNQKNQGAQSGKGPMNTGAANKDAQGKSAAGSNLKEQGKNSNLSSRQDVKNEGKGLGYDTDARAGQAGRSGQSDTTGRREDSEIKGAAGKKSTLGNMKEEDSDLDELNNPRA